MHAIFKEKNCFDDYFGNSDIFINIYVDIYIGAQK